MKPPPGCVNPNHWMSAEEALSTMQFTRADGTPHEPATDEEVEATRQRLLGLTDNANPNHGKDGEFTTSDKAKFVGQTVGKFEHVHAANVEQEVADMINGRVKSLEGGKYAARDIQAGKHAVEVKALLKGEKQSISMHPDALLRKVQYLEEHPGDVFHTVAVDERQTYDNGEHAGSFSGNRLYYKRGAGRYSLSQMHPVKSATELRRLMRASDDELPDRAKGGMPKDVDKLVEAAEAAHASRLAKDRARKERLRDQR